MCLSDPDTAVLIGGEAAAQQYCTDSLWKLELGQGGLKYLARGVYRSLPAMPVCSPGADEEPITGEL